MKFYLIFIIVLVVMSLITFALYAMDKSKAKKGEWRIKEAVLLGCSFFCGAIGGTLAMQLLRHKTKHYYFWVVNILGLVWQIGVLILLIVTQWGIEF